MSKNKPNKVIEEQLDKSFDFLPNGDELKKGFADSLAKSVDITKEPEDVLTGVGQLNHLDIDALESLPVNYSETDDLIKEHEKDCEACKNEEECEEIDCICDNQIAWQIFSDGKIVDNPDGTSEIKEDTITIQCNWECNTFQVIKSPKIEEHGLCSLCYPNQADLDSEGNHKCYALPDEYKYNPTN